VSDPVDQDPRELEAIRQLKARYFRSVDTKDWAGVRSVFVAEAVISVECPSDPDALLRLRERYRDGARVPGPGEEAAALTGTDAWVSTISRALAEVRTVHHGHMPEIELTSGTTATGIWAMDDRVEWSSSGRREGACGSGHYFEDYVKGDDGWRISTMRLVYRTLEALPPEPLPPVAAAVEWGG